MKETNGIVYDGRFFEKDSFSFCHLSLHVRELKKQVWKQSTVAKADAHFSRNFMRGYREREQAYMPSFNHTRSYR